MGTVETERIATGVLDEQSHPSLRHLFGNCLATSVFAYIKSEARQYQPNGTNINGLANHEDEQLPPKTFGA
jgi:hypothetical protein